MEKVDASRVKVWECIGCGRIEAPQPCIGICEDRAAELVHAEAHDHLARNYAQLLAENVRMRELLIRLAGTCPLDGQWEAGYRALQRRARHLLETQPSRASTDGQ